MDRDELAELPDMVFCWMLAVFDIGQQTEGRRNRMWVDQIPILVQKLTNEKNGGISRVSETLKRWKNAGKLPAMAK